MKLTAFILLTACLSASASGYSQITLSEKNAPLKTVFKKIEQQSGYHFLYPSDLVQKAGTVTIDVRNVSLEQALKTALNDKQLSFVISDRTVVIKASDKASDKQLAEQQDLPSPPPIDVRGRVTNEDGEPAPGVTVTVKGTKNATATDAAGEFLLKGVADNASLVFTSANMETQEIQISGRTELTVSLKTKVSSLNDVKIIAYGTTTERLRTGAVSSVKSDVIERQPVGDVLLALAGQVPGLYLSQGTAMPGARVNMNIRGLTSLNAQSLFQVTQDPLVVIDGVPFSTDIIFPGAAGRLWDQNAYQGGFSALSSINPMDIERVDVLKDADATAIYGSRGANGVILITTKRAKAGKPSLNINFSQGIGKMSRKMDLLSTRQYLDMRYEAYANDGINWRTLNFKPADLAVWDTTRYTDWQEELVGGTAKYTTANLSYSGGTVQNSFRISTSYRREGSVLGDQYKDEKFSGGITYNHTSTNNRLKFNVASFFTYNNMLQPNSNPYVAAISLPPNAPKLYNDDGSLNWENGTFNNPIADLLETQDLKSKNININGGFSYRVAKSLTLKIEGGYTEVDRNMTSLIPLASYNPFTNINTGSRTGRYTRNNSYTTNFNTQANYVAKLGPGKLDALAAFQMTRQGNEDHRIVANDFLSDQMMHNYGAASNINVDPVRSYDYRYVGLIGRLAYNISDKYLFTLNGNRDGSSRFGPGKQFGNFGSAAMAWIFSEESAIKKALPFLSFGKLRLSYGISGSDNIGNYNYLDLFEIRRNEYYYNPPFLVLQPQSLFNPDYAWEKTRKSDVELNLGFLQDRVMVKANYYNNRTSNQLVGETLPMTTGFRSVNGNGPDKTVQNSGWELQLNTEIVQSKHFSWSSNLIFSMNRNKLISFPDLEGSAFARYFKIGSPINLRRAYKHSGVNPQTGLNLYRMRDGKDTSLISSYSLGLAEQYLYMDLTPGFDGGWNNSFQYKNWSLSLSAQFAKTIRGDNLTNDPSIPGLMANIPQYVFNNAWRKPGDHALFQRFTTNLSSPVYRSRTWFGTEQYYRNTWYVSLNNLALSYALPDPLLKRLHLSSCRFYVNGQNLFTVSNLRSHDPTTTHAQATPRLRIITTGVNLNF